MSFIQEYLNYSNMSLNKVMLIGNVGKDPEVRYLDGNNAGSGSAKVAQFTLATTERFRDRNGELRENTEWHNIVAWRNSADVAEKFVRKGTQLYIEGKLRTRSWTDQGDSLQLLGKKSDNPAAAAHPASQHHAQAYQLPAQSYQQQAQAYQRPAPEQRPVQAAQVADVDEGPTDDLPF